MSRHLVSVEVDTSRSRYGTDWEAEHDQPAHLPEEVPAYAETFGAGPGDQWDHPPYTRVVSVEPFHEERPTLRYTYAGPAVRLTPDEAGSVGVGQSITGAFRVLYWLPTGGAVVGNGEQPESIWATFGPPEECSV